MKFELIFTEELLGDNDIGKSIYEEIIACHPKDTNALLNVAALYYKQMFSEEAIGIYSRAMVTIVLYGRYCFHHVQPADGLFTRVRSPFSDCAHQSSEASTLPLRILP